MNLAKWLAGLMLAALPASGSYELNSYGFGTGGGNGSSTNYSVNGIAGEAAGSGSSGSYKVGAGETYVKQANVPTAAFTNDDNWYNKLKLVISPADNPSDALFAVAISSDNFTTTQYVQSDFTIGPSLDFGDYQTYAAWGGASGQMVRGLSSSTVYSVKVKAYRGKFTESPYGPVVSAATVNPQLAFDIDVAATDTSTNPPYVINLGNLMANNIVATSDRIWVSLDTNGESGGKVYLSSQYAGLFSLSGSYTIASATGNLAVLTEAFGAQGVSATQTSGGPFTLTAPYNGAGDNVGVTDTLIREIFDAPGPLTGGRGSFILKAKTQTQTPASVDYTEILTAIAAASF